MAEPTMLSRALVSQALADDKFFALLPEFRPLQAQLKAMDVQLQAKTGCSSCAKRRVEANLTSAFLTVLMSLPPAQMATFKRYAGVDSLMFSTQNAKTGAFETHRL